MESSTATTRELSEETIALILKTLDVQRLHVTDLRQVQKTHKRPLDIEALRSRLLETSRDIIGLISSYEGDATKQLLISKIDFVLSTDFKLEENIVSPALFYLKVIKSLLEE